MKLNKFVALLIISLLLSCSKNSGVAGKYSFPENPYAFIELKDDGSFFLQKDKKWAYVGKYQIEGENITMVTELGFATKGTIKDNKIQLEIGTYTKE